MTIISAAALSEGDVYLACGFEFTATEVRHDQPGNGNGGEPTRTLWTAVWTGEGADPGPGYRRFSSGGNCLHPIHLSTDKKEHVPCPTP